MFGLDKIGVHNLQIEGFDPVLFSILGMFIVFCGLSIISLYIVILPKILDLPAQYRRRKIEKESKIQEDKGVSSEGSGNGFDHDMLIAIATAFHLDQDFPEETQKITWKSHGDVGSAWQTAGIAHGLAVRNHVHISRRRY